MNKKGVSCVTYGGEQRCVQGLVVEPEGNGPLGKPRRREENNI